MTADTRLLGDLATFARIEVSSRDVEPWADLLGWLYRAGRLDTETAVWALTLYNTYDDLGSAWQVLARWPTPQVWAAAGDRDQAAGYPLTGERRNLRGGRVLRRLASYAAQLGGESQLGWLTVPLRFDSPQADFDRLVAHLRQVWGVGRQAGFEWAEFLAKVVGLPVGAGHAHLWESEGPRRALQRLYRNPQPTPAWLDARATDTLAYLAAHGVRVGVEDVETLVCDFHVMGAGRYYPGRHLAALRHELTQAPPADRELLAAAWAGVVPAPWVGIAPGIRKDLLSVYRDTGRIVDHP